MRVASRYFKVMKRLKATECAGHKRIIIHRANVIRCYREIGCEFADLFLESVTDAQSAFDGPRSA